MCSIAKLRSSRSKICSQVKFLHPSRLTVDGKHFYVGSDFADNTANGLHHPIVRFDQFAGCCHP